MVWTTELKLKILHTTRRKVEMGHVIGTCSAPGKKSSPNPIEGYCLRGAIERAAKENGLAEEDAVWLSHNPSNLKLDLGGQTPCSFSDTLKKAGCLKAIDAALAKFPKAA